MAMQTRDSDPEGEAVQNVLVLRKETRNETWEEEEEAQRGDCKQQ